MGMTFSLTLEQTQKLIMTQELRQAISILQLNIQELINYVQKELEENPFLDLADDSTKTDEPETEPDWAEYFRDKSDLGFSPAPVKREEGASWENFVSQETTLSEYLLQEWELIAPDPLEKHIGAFIIGNLDEHGYLTISTSEIACALKLPLQRVLQVLRKVQLLDPPGVGARCLEECLLIQARVLGRLTPAVRDVIQYYLRDLAEGRVARVAQQLHLSVHEVQEIRDLIRTLDPKPGRRFASGDGIHYVIPDVVVEKVEGEYVILVNDAIANRLTVNNFYRGMLTNDSCDTDTKRYLEQKLNSALWLIKSIEQRRLTIYRIVEALLRRQRAFFDHGVRHLQPLTLRQVADEIGVHESTVSRATAGKYIQTPWGVFALRFLFGSGVEGVDGTAAAAESVKRLLADLVADEDPARPLSDKQMADILRQRGINLSRRTVAKYRSEARIPPSSARRRF